MTLKGKHPMGAETQKKIGRLIHLHKLTHPRRVAQRFGISPDRCQQIWTAMNQQELTPTTETLTDLLSPSS